MTSVTSFDRPRSAGARRRVLGLASALALLATACGSAADAPVAAGQATADAAGTTVAAEAAVEPVTVVATTSILGDVVSSILGEAGEVTVVIPSGTDPHGYAPSARDATLLRDADLVVANGLDLEESLIDTLEAAETDGVAVVRVAEIDGVDPLAYGERPFGDDHGHGDGDEHADDEGDDGHGHGDGDEDEHAEEDEHGDDDGHGHGEFDPHVWFDPQRMAFAVEQLTQTLEELRPDAGILERGTAYAAELRELDTELAEILSAIPDDRRRIVTNHDALGYLAFRYDLEVVGTVIPGTNADVNPSAREFAALAELLAETGVPAIFTENTGGDRLAQALAEQVGRDVVVAELYTDALGPEGSEAATYPDMLRANARILVDALA